MKHLVPIAKDIRTDTQLFDQLADVEAATSSHLRVHWKHLFRHDAPLSMSDGLMRQAIAYRMQAQVFGDVQLGHALVRTAKNLETGSQTPADDPGAGVKLIRSWHGELHEVAGVGDRFVYRGESFRSLSAIARHITGTKYNGLTFFGVRDRADLSRAVRRG